MIAFPDFREIMENHYPIVTNAVICFLIVFAVLVLNQIAARLTKVFSVRARAASKIWRAAVIESLDAPVRGAAWIIGLTVAVGILTRGGEFTLLSQFFSPARNVAVIGVIMWFLLRVVARVEAALHERAQLLEHEIDPTAADAIGKLVRAAIIITASLVVMQTLGFSISGLLAFGGIGGIAIGFAAQGLVANLFGGLTVYASRPFKVGEWIIMPGTEVMGEVQKIGWRATRVMGFDRRPFYVPNALFNTAVLINHSRMTARRIQEYIHIRYRDIGKVREIVADAEEMLSKHPGIESEFFVFRLDTCGDFALKMLLYAFTTTTDYSEFMSIKEDVILKISEIVEGHGCELSVPTSTVHMPDGLRVRTDRGQAAPEPFTESLINRSPAT